MGLVLEFKIWRLKSEAEISFIVEHLDCLLFLLALWDEPNVELKCVLSIMVFASNSFHNHGVKNNHNHVTIQRILNKFIEINFSLECMVWP